MSEAKDFFYTLLVPKIQNLGYQYKKSKNSFEKKLGDIVYEINSNWDGRGGLTQINHFAGRIKIPKISKATESILGFPIENLVPMENFTYFDEQIPQMYSSELLQAPNLKAMSQITFERKYPKERIEKTSNFIFEKIFREIIPYHRKFPNELKILEFLTENVGRKLIDNQTFGLMQQVLIVKLLHKKLEVKEPDFISKIDIFSKETFDEHWNSQHLDTFELQQLFNQFKF